MGVTAVANLVEVQHLATIAEPTLLGGIQPEGLSGLEVDDVLTLIRLALDGVDLKLLVDPKPIPG